MKEANHTANDLKSCSYFKNKHSLLFNKFANSRQKVENKSSSGRSAIVSSRPGTSTDSSIGPAHANNPHDLHKQKKNNSKSTAPGTVVDNKKSKKASKSTLNNGKSYTSSTAGSSNHRVEALIGAFSKLLRDFCNAS